MKRIICLLGIAPLLVASAVPGRFPEIEDGWLDNPAVITIDEVKGVLIGMTRHQVYHQLGEPHFNEGIRARTWNYMFDLRNKGTATGTICSLQLVYKEGRVAKIDWQTESCANIAK
jgi:outer membrane protein assembly factor BamE (lipoprotein component of BamABCDE complex)